MSQRSRHTRNSQRAINSSQNFNASQSERLTQIQPQTQSVSDDLVHKCVRLFLVKLGSNVPIKRTQIVQQLFKERPGKTFDAVIKHASEILQREYGLKLHTLDADTAAKKFILTNELEHPELIHSSVVEDFKTTITFLVLTHIFMSKDSATEISLWEFFKSLNILPEKEMSGVGNVHTFITKQLVKEQYIQLEAIGIANEDGETKKRFSWGSRADECVSKMEILKFVSKMYGNLSIKSWSSRYEEAVEQSGDNSDEMVVDDDDDE